MIADGRRGVLTCCKVLGAISLIGALFVGGLLGWNKWQDRRQPVTEFKGIELGMRPGDVSLVVGEPRSKTPKGVEYRDEVGTYSQTWIYFPIEDERMFFVIFWGESEDRITVGRVCQPLGFSSLLGFNRYSREQDIIDELGEPSSVSIHSNGLTKFINFREWNVAYQITKGEVGSRCIATEDVKYAEEYGQSK